jgi:hypothetical protein
VRQTNVLTVAVTKENDDSPIGAVVGWLISRNAKKEIDAYLESLLDMMSSPSQGSNLFIDDSVNAERCRSIAESKVGCPLSPWNIADLQISQPESFC